MSSAPVDGVWFGPFAGPSTPVPASWPGSRGADLWASLSVQLEAFRSTEADVDVPAPVTVRRVRILDVGGGSGQVAVPIAESGYDVTVVDPHPEALAALRRRAAGVAVGGRVRTVAAEAGSVLSVVAPRSQHLVLCHELLDRVEDVSPVLKAMVAALRPGGVLSAVVANRDAALLSRLIAGQFAVARHIMSDVDGRGSDTDPVRRRFDVTGLVGMLREVGLDVEAVHGIRPVADLIPAAVLEADPGAGAALSEIETVLCGRSPFRELSTHVHALARRPPGEPG